MVTENLAMAEERLCATPTGAADGDHNAYDNPSDLGAFVSTDELEEFLRNFDGGEAEEASLQTQGDADVGGEPITTVH